MSRRVGAVLLAAGLLAAPARAGNNFGGTALLSWSAVAEVGDLASVPPSMVPLYLLLTGAPDVQQLAVELRWTPSDLVGPCYFLVSKDSTTAPCAWTSYPLDPPGVFDGDSAYTWRISFAGPSRSCVTYIVGGEHCDGRPASFCLISVKTLDSDGEIDELAVLGNATILGGTEQGCPVVAQDIYPHVAVAGGENTFTVQGRDLAQNTQIALVDDGVSAPAASVVVSGDTTATAKIPVPSGFSGTADVVISTATSADTLRSRVLMADPKAGLPPVWELNVTESGGLPRASIAANEFTNPAYLSSFPVSALPIKHRTETAAMTGEGSAPTITMDLVPLALDVNGRFSSGGLPLIPASSVAVDRWSGKVAVLLIPGPGGRLPTMPTSLGCAVIRLDAQATENNRLLGWERSPTDQWSVVQLEEETKIFGASPSAPSLRLPGRTHGGTFSDDGRRWAGTLEDGRGRRWVLISSSQILRQGELTTDAISQLNLCPGGTVLTFTRQRSAHDRPETVGVDLATGQERVLTNIPAGTRYYSGDGKTMAVVQQNPGRLSLLDVTDPLNPVEIAASIDSPDGDFITAAISGDGALVALMMLETDNNPHHTLTRVVVFDRGLQQRALVTARSSLAGLQFQGRFLFVGMQRHPIPSYFMFNPTTQIALYDLSNL